MKQEVTEVTSNDIFYERKLLLIRKFRKFRGTRLALPSLFMVLLMLLCAVFADYLAPYSPYEQNYSSLMEPPSPNHLFGTDILGRDMFSRVIHGSRISVSVGVMAVIIGLSIGVLLGLIAGYRGGYVDAVIMRSMDALMSIPGIFLALALMGILGPGLKNLMIAIGVSSVPPFTRLVRGEVLALREREFIDAARALGAKDSRIILKHILPNVATPIIVEGSLRFPQAVLAEASLSFLGLGMPPPLPSWGQLVKDGFPFLELASWISVIPGLVIFVMVLSMNFVGDAIRDANDPSLKQ